MPLYEYHCTACDTTFEANQRMSEDPLTTCTSCGEEGQVKRLLSSGNGLIFKGSGFYITDYKNGNSSGASSASSETTTKTETKSESKPAESKPAASSSHSCGSGCGCG